MAKKIMKGKFITLEGPEGSGKSTQSRLLCAYLKKEGYRIVYTREPGGTIIGEKIRRILLDPKNKAMNATTEMFLYMASRSQLMEEVILPALKQGRIVVCDRFLDATICYQGYGGGLDIGRIKEIGKLATSGITPDLSIFLDIETIEGLKRSGKNPDRIERKSIAYHRRVRKGYLELARQNPRRIKVISAAGDIAATEELVRRAVNCLLRK